MRRRVISSPAKNKRPLAPWQRNKRERFRKGDVILSYGQPFECFGAVKLSSGRLSQRYRLLARCDDCGSPFWQEALRFEIKADQLRRRCDDCKAPMRVTRPVAKYAAERRREKAEEREKRRLDVLHLRRIARLSAATGQTLPVAMDPTDLTRAEQRHARKLRLAHQQTVRMLGIPMSEVIAIDIERRLRLSREAQGAHGDEPAIPAGMHRDARADAGVDPRASVHCSGTAPMR